MTVLLVALGAAVGAPLRYLTDQALRSAFPFGTLTVNVAGSLLLGLLAGLAVPPPVAALLGTGFCGALTTYSTFGWETLSLPRGRAVLYVAVSIVAGLAAALAGRAIGSAV